MIQCILKVILNNTRHMAIITFKTSEIFKKNLILISQLKGINMSAYIKLILTDALKEEMNNITKNGLTVAEELEIIQSDFFDKTYGPFKNTDDLMKALKKKPSKVRK